MCGVWVRFTKTGRTSPWQKDDKQHMAEYDGVYVFRPADGEGVPCHFDNGDGKMYQNAYCQQDFDAQHDAERAVEWVVKYRQVAVVHHHDAADEQGNDDRRHYADGTMGHGTFDFAA